MFTRPDKDGMAWSGVLYFVLVSIVVAMLAGLGGAGLAWFLHHQVSLIYGSSAESVAAISAETTPWQRFFLLTLAGVVMAILWWSIRRWGPKLANPEQAAEGITMSPGWTTAEALVEVANVGAGASIGRESAPREVGAMAADRIAIWTRLHPEERSVLIACAAGAALGATYNVPLTGAIFGIETVLGLRFLRRTPFAHLAIILPLSLGISYVAILAGRVIIPNEPVYRVENYGSGFSLSLIVFSCLIGLALGPLGYLAGRLFTLATRRSPRGNALLWLMPAGYALVGLLAAWQPAVMGNGHLLAQDVFDGNLDIPMLILLAGLKPLATTLTMGSGARGGRLTPAFSTGAALGAAGGTLWGRLFSLSMSGAALSGSAAVLAAATASPVTAVALSMEMTGAPWSMALPTGLAVFMAWSSGFVLDRFLLHRSFKRRPLQDPVE